MRFVLMFLALVLTLALPAILSSLEGFRAVRSRLSLLVVVLVLQIAGEILIVSLGYRPWLPFYEAPFTLFRLGQLGELWRQSDKVDANRKALFQWSIGLNVGLWIVVAVRVFLRMRAA